MRIFDYKFRDFWWVVSYDHSVNMTQNSWSQSDHINRTLQCMYDICMFVCTIFFSKHAVERSFNSIMAKHGQQMVDSQEELSPKISHANKSN